MSKLKLFMLLVGCKPEGRHTEQHDVFFGIGEKIEDTFDDVRNFWPEAGEGIHIDSWREVNYVQNPGGPEHFEIEAIEGKFQKATNLHLFFINLGGYTKDVFDEQHEKLLVVARSLDEAKTVAKKSDFYISRWVKALPTAKPHIDDKYVVDVDDALRVEEILPARLKKSFSINASPDSLGFVPDKITLGYNFVNLKVPKFD